VGSGVEHGDERWCLIDFLFLILKTVLLAPPGVDLIFFFSHFFVGFAFDRALLYVHLLPHTTQFHFACTFISS